MESEEHISISEWKEKIFQSFSDFMSRVAKFEEFVAVGCSLLVGFHEELEFLRRPPIDKTSGLIEHIFRANETKRVLTYVETGCVNAHDSIQNISKFKCIVNELEGLVKEVTGVIRTANESKSNLLDKISQDEFGPEATAYEREEAVSSELQKPEATDYAEMMAVIYSMVKQDYIMQEKIISSLNLKSSPGELESYSLMWSLRPFINDEIMHQAWSLIP